MAASTAEGDRRVGHRPDSKLCPVLSVLLPSSTSPSWTPTTAVLQTSHSLWQSSVKCARDPMLQAMRPMVLPSQTERETESLHACCRRSLPWREHGSRRSQPRGSWLLRPT